MTGEPDDPPSGHVTIRPAGHAGSDRELREATTTHRLLANATHYGWDDVPGSALTPAGQRLVAELEAAARADALIPIALTSRGVIFGRAGADWPAAESAAVAALGAATGRTLKVRRHPRLAGQDEARPAEESR